MTYTIESSRYRCLADSRRDMHKCTNQVQLPSPPWVGCVLSRNINIETWFWKLNKWICSCFSLKIPFLLNYSIFIILLQILQITRLSFPYLNNSISRSSYNEALCCLERGNICDDVVMSHRQRLWAPPRRVITWSYLLLILNFLFHD